jgi:hypothetical protein
MKQSPQTKQIVQNMQPGVITLEGFLGTDRRDLQEILEDDNGIVKRMHLTHQRIAHRMNEFRQRGEKGLGEFISIEPHFEVRVDTVRGKLPCPFLHPGIYRKANTTVRNTKLGREITYTDLHIHMIEAHGFYEGKGSRFRLEPEDLAEILEVKPVD